VQAATPAEMYRAIGLDCWVVVPIRSLSRSGHTLEGTRLTITCSKETPDGNEFSIRTPVTPSRWEDFDKELTHAFEAILAAVLADGVSFFSPWVLFGHCIAVASATTSTPSTALCCKNSVTPCQLGIAAGVIACACKSLALSHIAHSTVVLQQ
jgi:hypothetical protein